MKTLAGLGASILVIAALAFASRRIATHQAVLPRVSRRVNTRVIRINQHRPSLPRTTTFEQEPR